MSKSESLEAKPSEAEPLEVEGSKSELSEAKLSEVEPLVAELPEAKLSETKSSETKSSEPKPSGIRPPSKIERLCSSRPRRPDIPPSSPVKSVTTKISESLTKLCAVLFYIYCMPVIIVYYLVASCLIYIIHFYV